MQHISSLIREETNVALLRYVTQEEVDQTIRDMQVEKSPRLDGFTLYFFHHYWPMVHEEGWTLVEDLSWVLGALLALNTTILTLIPKKEQISHSNKFRPIALCNVIYKLIAKVLPLYLKPLLTSILSLEQLRYVEGREIMDSVILAHEVIHSLKSSCTPGMLVKLDLSKSFDKLSWVMSLTRSVFSFI